MHEQSRNLRSLEVALQNERDFAAMLKHLPTMLYLEKLHFRWHMLPVKLIVESCCVRCETMEVFVMYHRCSIQSVHAYSQRISGLVKQLDYWRRGLGAISSCQNYSRRTTTTTMMMTL
jgi:hypothetical protein